MNTREQYERGHNANLTKITQLVADAEEKANQDGVTNLSSEQRASRRYWIGVRDGLRRAQAVLEGHG